MRIAPAVIAVISAGRTLAQADPAPACGADIVVEGTSSDFKAKLMVGGVDTGLDASPDYQHWKDAHAEVWARDAKTILLAWGMPGHRGAPDGSDALYEIDCAAPAKPRVFARFDGANFGATALASDGRTLYVSGFGGVHALDLVTKQLRVVTEAPKATKCEDRVERLTDTVKKLDERADVLEIERGGPCGFEGDWTAKTYYVDHPAKPRGQPTTKRPRR